MLPFRVREPLIVRSFQKPDWPIQPGMQGCRSGMTCTSTFQCRSMTSIKRSNCPRMTSVPPVPRASTASSTMKLNAHAGFRLVDSNSCRARRAAVRSFSSSSSGIGGTLRDTARMYASVCNNPGTTRHSYVYRLIAVASSLAHCRNHAASPGCRARHPAALRNAPRLPSASSARSTNAGSGIRRPCSTDATVCLE
ncbi:hypothetical protein SUDANB51_02032 [Streptomyces sp. enrichment culture]